MIAVRIRRVGEVSIQHTVCLCISVYRRSIYQQVVGLIAVGDALQSVVIEQRLIEEVVIQPKLVFRIMMTGKVDGRHIRISRCQVGIVRILWLRVCHEVHSRVEVSHIHRLRLIVSRCTIYAVALISIWQTTAVLHDA